jgi:hypothetical protein
MAREATRRSAKIKRRWRARGIGREFPPNAQSDRNETAKQNTAGARAFPPTT